MKVECERCENGMVFKWFPTRHGWDTKAQACEECNGSGKVEADITSPMPSDRAEWAEHHKREQGAIDEYVTEHEGDERHQPHRDSGLPTFEQVQEWRRLKD